MSARISPIKTKSAPVTSLAVQLPPPDTLALTLALQTTLMLEDQLAILSREIGAVVTHDSLSLRAPARGLDLRLGTPARHRCAYQLTLMDEDLGEIELTRQRRFGEAELAAVEVMLAAVVYPLRNALSYRDALRAAYKDPLTGVGNRLAMDEALPREIHVARRNNQPLALIAIDLDHFKRVNDRHGHLAGDCVLRTAALRIQGAIRTSDQLFRYGGEEFVVLLNNTGEEGALCVAERIRQAIAVALTQCAEHAVQITASLGVAVAIPGDTAGMLFARADHALYRAKAAGRNRAEVQREMTVA
jgi:diguanylate cyclase (GGDEF)-like protein